MDIEVQCIDFCEATSLKVHAIWQHARSGLQGVVFSQHPGDLVATVGYQENPHRYKKKLHVATFQFFHGAHIPLRVLTVAESREAQGLIDEIQEQPNEFGLDGPAIVITNVAAASAFLADGWSTESVSRVVITARKRQESYEKETSGTRVRQPH